MDEAALRGLVGGGSVPARGAARRCLYGALVYFDDGMEAGEDAPE